MTSWFPMSGPIKSLGIQIEEHSDGLPRSPTEPRGIVIALFRKHAERVRRSLGFRLRNDDDAQDATQETFLKLWRQERDGNLRADAVAYLNMAANTMAFDIHRRRAYHSADRVDAVEADDVPSGAPGIDEALHWRDALAVFVASVESLPSQTRDVFLLYHLKGLTYRQIATTLGISSRTAERHIEQALLKLQRKMKEYL